jgi:glycosyltransferase involved in cell wall biosynthesis
LIELWPSILKKIPDATLHISTYTAFPTNEREEELKRKIDSDDSIRYLGKLSPELMYDETNKAEYWLYTCNNHKETSCIVSLEMLMSEVICIYYPEAGLPYTVDKHGIQVQEGNEIDALLNLTEETKREMRTKGKEYAESCSWKNRAELWKRLLF